MAKEGKKGGETNRNSTEAVRPANRSVERETQRHEAAALGLGPSPQGVPCPYDDTAHRQPRGIKH